MKLRTTLQGLANQLPYVKRLYQENQQLKKNAFYPPGHYYSAIISVDDVKSREATIWGKRDIDGVDGINLRTNEQLALVREFYQYYADIPFHEPQTENLRYYFNNQAYCYTDAIFLYSMMRHYKPKQIIEAGSGFSSAIMLDVNERFFDNTIQLTFIDPEMDRLNSLLKEKDKASTIGIQGIVQSVPLSVFEKLNAGDILFIDSTHVSKTGSDVNYLFFEVLPVLKSGVLIHIHDVFYPFEYLKEWVFKGWNWNEDYIVRAFLMYNNAFDILLFSDYLHTHHAEIFKPIPLCYKNSGGSLWLRKK